MRRAIAGKDKAIYIHQQAKENITMTTYEKGMIEMTLNKTIILKIKSQFERQLPGCLA